MTSWSVVQKSQLIQLVTSKLSVCQYPALREYAMSVSPAQPWFIVSTASVRARKAVGIWLLQKAVRTLQFSLQCRIKVLLSWFTSSDLFMYYTVLRVPLLWKMTFQTCSLVFLSEGAFSAAYFEDSTGWTVHGNCNCFWEVDFCKGTGGIMQLAQKLASQPSKRRSEPFHSPVYMVIFRGMTSVNVCVHGMCSSANEQAGAFQRGWSLW